MAFDTQIKYRPTNELIRPVEESEIIRRIIAGEKDLYAEIMRKYNQRFYRIALAIVNNESEVPDIMQTAYLKAYENLDHFGFRSSFATWITRILINESLMYVKKTEQVAQKQQTTFSTLSEQPATDFHTPLKNVLNTELKNILEVSIRRLPEKYRTVFVMREIESMNVNETMECLGLSAANVKVRLNRAKVILRNKLGEYLKDEEVMKLYKPICNRIVANVMEVVSENKTF